MSAAAVRVGREPLRSLADGFNQLMIERCVHGRYRKREPKSVQDDVLVVERAASHLWRCVEEDHADFRLKKCWIAWDLAKATSRLPRRQTSVSRRAWSSLGPRGKMASDAEIERKEAKVETQPSMSPCDG